MGSYSRTSRRRIPKAVHLCYRGQSNNTPQPDPFVKCHSFTRNHSGGGCNGMFSVPTMHWDEHFGEMKDAELAVFWGINGAGNASGQPDILCYVNVDSARRDKDNSNVTFSAVSVAARLKKVIVGAHRGKPDLKFINRPKGSTTATGSWTPSKVLRALFDEDNLPSFWRSKVILGDLGVLDEGWDFSNAPDFIFSNCNLLSAIDQVISHCGDVYYSERFSPSFTTYLDFHRVSQPAAGYSAIVICRPGQRAEQVGANATRIENTANTEEVYSRVFGRGDFRRIMISILTTSVVAPLEKLWDTSSTVVYTDPATSTTYTAQTLVLKDANLSKGEKTPESYVSPGTDIQDVFRRYALPVEVQQFVISKDNAFKDSAGRRMKIQVWKIPLRLAEGDGAPNLAVGSVEAGYYEELKSVDLHLEEGYFTLGEPAINVKYIRAGDDGKIIRVYEEAVVGITLTLELDPLMHDTGQNDAITGDLLYPWQADGEQMIAPAEQYEYAQITNVGFDLSLKGDDTGPEYGCIYRNPETGIWHNVAVKTVLVDDSRKLRTFTRSVLREKSKRNRSYSVECPWLTRSFPLGSKTVVTGQANWVYDTYAISRSSFDLDRGESSLSIDTVRPPHTQEAVV